MARILDAWEAIKMIYFSYISTKRNKNGIASRSVVIKCPAMIPSKWKMNVEKKRKPARFMMIFTDTNHKLYIYIYIYVCMYNIMYIYMYLRHRQKPVIVNSRIRREFTNYEISVYIRTFEQSLVAHNNIIILCIHFKNDLSEHTCTV